MSNYSMKGKLFLFRSSFVLLLFCCSFTVVAQRSYNIDLAELGAVPNDGKDDSPAFIALLKIVQTREGICNVNFPAGTLELKEQINFLNVKADINLIGNKKGSVIRVNGSGSLLIEPVITELKMARNADRKSNNITIQGRVPSEVNTGDLLHIQSSTVFETGWNYKENDLLRISRIEGNTIYFDDPILFNYQPTQETVVIKVYRKTAVSVTGIDFMITPLRDSVRANAMVIRGASVDIKNSTIRYTGKLDYYHNGIAITACENVVLNNIKLFNLMYGIPMNFCRNIKAYNTTAEDTRHAYVPASACVNVLVKGLKGKRCHSVMDSHVSFNVRFEDVYDTLCVYPPDIRALGATVINGRFSMANATYQLYAYWSVQGLTAEYTPMYAEYENYFKNVYWVSKAPGKLNGITAFSCRKFTLENCTTHAVGYYGDQKVIQEILIRNCRIGAIYSDANKVTVENTVMDGKLIPGTDFVFRFAGSGGSNIRNVKTINYNPKTTYLFSRFHNQPNANGLNISNSTFGNFKGFTDQLVNPGTKYNTLKIDKSSFGKFSQEVQKEFTDPQPMLKKKQ